MQASDYFPIPVKSELRFDRARKMQNDQKSVALLVLFVHTCDALSFSGVSDDGLYKYKKLRNFIRLSLTAFKLTAR